MDLTIVGCTGSLPGPDSPASCYLVTAEQEGRSWRVVLDTSGFDAAGSPSQAGVELEATAGTWQGQPWSLTVRAAGLSAIYLAAAD